MATVITVVDPPIDLTPYGCDCCGADCFCVTCTGDRCPEKLCVIFEGDGLDSDPGNKIVYRASLAKDETPGSEGWYNTVVPGVSFVANDRCFAGYLRVYVQYGYKNPFNATQLWAAEYYVDVPVDECEELLTPLDLTLDLDTVLADTHPTSSPPATVRVILSDPNVSGHPGEEDARNACCHNTESDYLCSRDAATDLPATIDVTVTSTVGNGPDPWGSSPLTASLLGVVYPTGYCWEATYRSDPVVWAGCSDETATIELLSYVEVLVQGNFYPHRHYPSYPYAPPGTSLITVHAYLAWRPAGGSGYGTVIDSSAGAGTPPAQGAHVSGRIDCEDFSVTLIPSLVGFSGSGWILPWDPPFTHYTVSECTNPSGGMSGWVTSITVAE